MNKNYIPEVGDSVCARRKIKSKTFDNVQFGMVIETWNNACRIVTNKGTETESDFQFFYGDWDFRFLHKTNIA